MNITINNLTVKAGSSMILCDVSHEFENGKLHCVIGPNGSGKTTLVKEIVKSFSRKESIAFVPQETFGNFVLQVRDVIALGRYDSTRFLYGESQQDKDRIEDAAKRMAISHLLPRLYDSLSGGEKQAVMIARALAQDANWLIMDEPCAHLDVKSSQKALSNLQDIIAQDNSKSCIVVLHDINMALQYASSIVLMSEGRILAAGKPNEAITNESLSEAYDSHFERIEGYSGRAFFIPT